MTIKSGEIIATPRLYLRLMLESDLTFLTELHQDEKVMKYIGPAGSKSQVANKLLQIRQYCKDQPAYGIWMACDQETQMPVGWACLKDLDGTLEREIGYRLAVAHWGKGYATELSLALVDYGFRVKKLCEIVGVTAAANHRSKSVLEKAGLRFIREAHYYHCTVLYYRIKRSEWRNSKTL